MRMRRVLNPSPQVTPYGTFLPMVRQLHILGLGAFEGRQHCGRDVRIVLSIRIGISCCCPLADVPHSQDTRNVARIVVELARRGMPLRPNTSINPYRRWPWMGRNGKILEEYVLSASTSL